MGSRACYRSVVHEIIPLEQRIAARRRNVPILPFSMERIRRDRYASREKHPGKCLEMRPSRPIARREALRLHPVAERTTIVDKLAHRVSRAGKLRLFRMWKLVGKHRGEVASAVDESAPPPPVRPLAERLAWLRRTRRL